MRPSRSAAALALVALFVTSSLLAPAAGAAVAAEPLVVDAAALPASTLDMRLDALRTPEAVLPDVPVVEAGPMPVATVLAMGDAVAEGPLPAETKVAMPAPLAGPVMLLRDATYIACGQVPAKAVVCLPAPVPLGTAVPLDVDGDALTGVGGMDVLVRLDPQLLPVPDLPGVLATGEPLAPQPRVAGGVPAIVQGLMPDTLSVKLEVQVLPGALDVAQAPLAPTRALAAKAWATYLVATPDGSVHKVLTAGFDGTWAPAGPAALPGSSTATFTLEDLPALLQGRALARVDGTFTQPSPGVALFAGFADADANGNPVDSTSVAFGVAPSSDFSVHVDALTDGSRAEVALTTTDAPVGLVTYDAQRGTATTHAAATLTKLPDEATVLYEKASDGVRITYDASAPIDRVDAAYHSVRSGETLDGALVVVGLPDRLVLDIAPGQDTGTVRSTASDGIASIQGTMSATKAGVTTVAHAALQNLPASVTVAWDSRSAQQQFSYLASAPWGPASFDYSSGPAKPAFGAAIDAPVPASAAVRWDPSARTIAWDASAPVGRVTATATLPRDGRVWQAALTLTGVPAQWSASFAPDHPVFRGGAAPLGGLAFTVTNHAAVTTYAGNHLSIVLAPNGDMDGSFAMSRIELAEFEKTATGFRVDLRMGGGLPFFLHGDVTANGGKARADLSISPLPQSIQVSQAGDAVTYNADTNFALTGYSEVGNPGGIASAPSPPSVRGLSARDGFGCDAFGCGRGIKGRVFLEGFPTGLTADPKARTYSVTNFRPPADQCTIVCIQRDSLTIDADLSAPEAQGQVAQRVRVLATQSDIPSPVSFTFGPLTPSEQTTSDCILFPVKKCTTTVDGRQMAAQFTSSAPLGALVADVIVGAIAGRLEVSNIPSAITVDLVQGRQTSTASVALSQGIARIFAGAKGTATDTTFAGGLELLQVPSSVSLTWGRVSATTSTGDSFTAPGFTYAGNAAGLDINAWVDASLFGGDIQAVARLAVADLAPSVTLALSGDTLSLSSRQCGSFFCPTSPTRTFEVHVWARIKTSTSDSGCENINGNPNCSATYVKWSYSAGVSPLTINDFALRLTNVGTLTMHLGFVSSVQGSFDAIHVGWQGMTATFDLEGSVAAKQEVCTFFGCSTVTLGTAPASWHGTNVPINLALYVFGNHETQAQCWGHVFEVHIRPDRHASYATNSLDLGRPTAGEGNAWFFMPVPSQIASSGNVKTVAELIAGQSSPLGGGIRGVLATC